MTLLEALKHSARFSLSPAYSLFGVSSVGEYELLLVSKTAQPIVDRFKNEASLASFAGLEVRCNGSRVSFSQT